MDFFQAQEKARRTSRQLVWWFMLCVLGVVISIYAVSAIGISFLGENASDTPIRWIDPGLFLTVAILIGGLIISGSLIKLHKLSAGGHVVAQDLGGRQIDRLTSDFHERRLMNVVEEMSIAAGTPMPGVWVMDDEPGINAFAAGTDPANAVVGVTRGAIERLTRDELQGVIAHEFSHILNGDMRLNMRLTGWVFGLLMVAILGRMMLQMLRFSGGRRSREGGGLVLFLLAVGGAVWLVGTIGAFFARWLQAAVSRQREYLADASAVQFTRNPPGLADALRKVGGGSTNGIIRAAAAAEARHLFFARSDMMELAMATHPPLDKRIKAIFPQWDGTMLASNPTTPSSSPSPSSTQPPPFPGGHGILGPVLGAMMASQHDGTSRTLQSKDDAKALVHALLLAEEKDPRLQGIDLITARQNSDLALRAAGWHEEIHTLESSAKLIWLDQALPWLKTMGKPEAESFIATNRALIEADGEVSLFEFMIEQVIDRNVAIATGLRPASSMRHRALADLEREIATIITLFASIGGDGQPDHAARIEYREHTGRELPRIPPDDAWLQATAALEEIDDATPLVKSQILRMCGLVAAADGIIQDQETELLRAVSESIGAPLPRIKFDQP